MVAARVDTLAQGAWRCWFDQECRTSAWTRRIVRHIGRISGGHQRSARKEDKMDGDWFIEFMGELEELVSYALLPNGRVQVAARNTRSFEVMLGTHALRYG